MVKQVKMEGGVGNSRVKVIKAGNFIRLNHAVAQRATC